MIKKIAKNKKSYKKTNIKKITAISFLLTSVAFLIMTNINFVSADRVGVILNFPDGSVHGECLQTKKDTNGYDLLQKLSLPTSWAGPSSFGHMLCKINNIGTDPTGDFCSFSGKFWSFYKLENSNWVPMPVGFDSGDSCWNNDLNSFGGHYCVKDKDVIGFKFIEYGDPEPAIYSFDKICNPLNLKDVRVYVNGKKQKDANEKGGTIEASPDSNILFKIEIENNYFFDDVLEIEEVEAEMAIENIDGNKDIEKKIKFKNLGVDENDENEFSFTVPTTLKEDEYDLELKITGKSPIGKQEITIDYDIEIDRKKHDLIFSKSELKNLESCPNDSNNLALEITNIGEKDEENILLTVKNADLSIDFSDSFSLKAGEKDSIYKKEFGFVVPSIIPGDYNLVLNLDYFGNTKEEITLTIRDCNQRKNTQTQATEESQTQKLKVKKTIPQRQTSYQKSFLEIYDVPILLGVFLVFLIASLILIMIIINR